MQVAALLPSQVSSFSVGVGRYKAKPLREPAVQATAYSPSGSTSSSPLVSYSTTSYFPARAPVSRTPSTASDVEPRGASASSSSFGDAASGASASESSFILTADPPLSRAQGGKNSSMRPRDMGVHAQQEPRRRPSTHQFNAISPVMANTCLPPSSSRLMIHRHSSVASRPRNACGMLGTVSSPIAQRAAAKRAAEAPRVDAPGARHQKGAQSCFLTVARDTLRCRPFAPRSGARQSKLNVYCVCVCVRARACMCVCVRVGRPGTHTKKSKRHFLLLFG